jgi:hypothetical protein
MTKCLCGKDATNTAYLPIQNVYSGLKPVIAPQKVCKYHAEKANRMGYIVD